MLRDKMCKHCFGNARLEHGLRADIKDWPDTIYYPKVTPKEDIFDPWDYEPMIRIPNRSWKNYRTHQWKVT